MMPAPAPSPSMQPLANPVAVVGPHFCVQYPVDLRIVQKSMTLKEGSFTITDVNGTLMFTIKGSIFSLHDRRVLLDAAGKPVISFQQKLLSMHRRWQAFRGDSSDPKDLLFTVKKSSFFQFKTQLDVLLPGKTKDDVPDFKIKGGYYEQGCTIYLGDSSTIIAQMHREHSFKSIVFSKDTYGVTVYPNVDYAFIVALVTILHEINEDRSGRD